MKYIFFLIFLLISSIGNAQTVILEEEPINDTIPSSFGPNRTHHLHQYISAGFILGKQAEGAAINIFLSNNFQYGIRYKLKWSNNFSSGIEVEYNADEFVLEQDEIKVVPDTFLHEREKLVFYSLAGALYQRINLDPGRGDYIGKYIDLGIGIDWIFSAAHKVRDELPGGEIRKINTTKLDYTESFYPYVTARFASNRIGIYGRYRLADLLKESYNFPDLPRLAIGLQIGFY